MPSRFDDIDFTGLSSFDRASIVKHKLGMVPVGVGCFIMGGGAPDGAETHGVNQFLLIKRKGSHGEGTWSVPGGWIDAGERVHAAVAREVWEEVGVNIDSGDLFDLGWSHSQFQEGIESITLWFRCMFYKNVPKITYPDKIEAIGWYSRDHLPKPLFQGFTDMVKKGFILP